MTELCRYHYDPLDRQSGSTIIQQPLLQRFNCKDRLATEIHGTGRRSIFQHDEQLLAQHNHLGADVTTLMLATDQQRSVLNALDDTRLHPLAYSPYGHRPAHSGLLSLLGFNGERPDPVTGHYHLGNGYRQFNPVLMRFNSPDSWSPFGEGGLNAYEYCGGEPINRVDPTGHMFKPLLKPFKKLSTQLPSTASKATFTDLTEDALIDISKYLSSSDMNNLRLVSKTTKNNFDRVSKHNLKVLFNKETPHIFDPRKPATQLDKLIEVGLGRAPGVSSSEAGKIISVKTAQEFYDTHTASTGSYQPTSLITGKEMFFTRTAKNINQPPNMELPTASKRVREN